MNKNPEKTIEIVVRGLIYLVKAYGILLVVVAGLALGAYLTSVILGPFNQNMTSSDISSINSAIIQINNSNLSLTEKAQTISSYESLNQALYKLKQTITWNITPTKFAEDEIELLILGILFWIIADYLEDKFKEASKEDESYT